jgi:hypothetical protein
VISLEFSGSKWVYNTLKKLNSRPIFN